MAAPSTTVVIVVKLQHSRGLKPTPKKIADAVEMTLLGEELGLAVDDGNGGFGSGHVVVTRADAYVSS
jgi:hypothetical protein